MKRAFTLIEALILIGVLAVIAAFLFPIFARGRESHRPSCQSPLKQIGLGILQYSQDYDDKYPPVRLGLGPGWAEEIKPYVKSEQIFQCPQGPSPPAVFSTDYFYSSRLHRVSLSKLPSPGLTIMGGDGDDNAATWNSWTGLPADATTNSNSPCQRHNGKGNYLFADGHVKALDPTAVSSTYAAPTSIPTFATW